MPDTTVRILAVDDVPQNLAALRAALDQPGTEIITAASGEEALELMLRHDFALALLDVQLPGMDGFELAELMRGTERTRGVPIIFLTAVATDEARRFRGFEAGAVDYMLKPVDIHVLNRKVAVFVELARQRLELARQRDELGMALDRLRAHSDNSPLAVIELDSNLRIMTWARGAERLFGLPADQMVGTDLNNAPFLPEAQRANFVQGMKNLLAGEHSEMQQHGFLTADGSARDGEWYCSSLAGGRRSNSVMLQVLDVTGRYRAQETQRLLIGELNHRVKNSLATVQAIASQSFRHAKDTADFREAFTGRIQALASAHSLLSATTWEPASLRKLVADQLEIGSVGADRMRLDGPDVDLPPELALRFALVLHELVTNAQKYGALAQDGGTVAFSWTCDDALLAMEWVEQGGPPVSAPAERGFGSVLIESSLASEGGSAAVAYLPHGVRWTLSMPVESCKPVFHSSPDGLPPLATAPKPGPATDGLRVLIVEDEPLVAMELVMGLEDAGHHPLGPYGSCDQAMEGIDGERPEFALLDGNLNGEPIDTVADTLADRNIPFAFVSGYGREHLPTRHRDRPLIAKPFAMGDVLAALGAHGRPVRQPSA